MANANDRDTVRPAAYPALEAEVYHSLDCINDRVTLMPDAAPLDWEPQAPPVPLGHESWSNDEPSFDSTPIDRSTYDEDRT